MNREATWLSHVNRALLFVFTGCVLVFLWTSLARTERWVHHKDGHYGPKYSNIIEWANGRVGAPFVSRRLPADAARGLVTAVPESSWRSLEEWLGGDRGTARWLRGWFDSLSWPPEQYPLLVSVHLVILLSAVGFLYACRALFLSLYRAPSLLADGVALLCGWLVLGGLGEAWYGYPYDIPNLFLFTVGLVLLVRRSPFFLVYFPLVVWSKETSVLLVLGYALLAKPTTWRERLLPLGWLCGSFLLMRGWIHSRFPSPPAAVFWFPERNALLLLELVLIHSWIILLLLLAGLAMARQWREFPADARRLLAMLPVLLGLVAHCI